MINTENVKIYLVKYNRKTELNFTIENVIRNIMTI